MFKAVLCIIIFLCSGGLGMLKAMTFSSRLQDLQDLKEMLQILETEISYRKDPLGKAFARIAEYKENRAMELLRLCSQKMKQNQEFRTCWEAAIAQVYSESALTSEDLLILKDMGLQMGKSSIDGQASMFVLVNLKLDRQIKQAREEKWTRGRMYRSLGFAIGAVIAIVLI